jgi:hypothetical protein
MDNRFLNNFLKGRQSLANDMESASKPSKAGKPPKTTISVATIIEDKPPKSKVMEYFRKRIEELEDSDMDD